ncbi:MAG: ATP synthase F1 subunit epsilon [Saccharofermentanales bacterium]
MNDKLHIEVVTPYDLFYEGDVDQLVLPALDGEIGIWPGHAPTIIALTPGEMRITVEGKVLFAAVSDGYAQIEIDNVIVVAGSAERPAQIDKARAEKSLFRAEKRLNDPAVSTRERERTVRAILRSKARIKVADKAPKV